MNRKTLQDVLKHYSNEEILERAFDLFDPLSFDDLMFLSETLGEIRFSDVSPKEEDNKCYSFLVSAVRDRQTNENYLIPYAGVKIDNQVVPITKETVRDISHAAAIAVEEQRDWSELDVLVLIVLSVLTLNESALEDYGIKRNSDDAVAQFISTLYVNNARASGSPKRFF